MRYELNDFEWTAIKPMLPNRPCGVRRVNDRVMAGMEKLGTTGRLHKSGCALLLACQGCIHPAHFPKAYISSSQLGQAQCHQRAATPTQPAKFPMSAIAAGDREIASRIGFSADFRASSTGRMNDLPQVICPSGGLWTGVSSPFCKNIFVFTPPKSPLELFASRPTQRGVSRSSRT